MQYAYLDNSCFVLKKVNVKTNSKAYFWQNDFCQSGYLLAEKNLVFGSNKTESFQVEDIEGQ